MKFNCQHSDGRRETIEADLAPTIGTVLTAAGGQKFRVRDSVDEWHGDMVGSLFYLEPEAALNARAANAANESMNYLAGALPMPSIEEQDMKSKNHRVVLIDKQGVALFNGDSIEVAGVPELGTRFMQDFTVLEHRGKDRDGNHILVVQSDEAKIAERGNVAMTGLMGAPRTGDYPDDDATESTTDSAGSIAALADGVGSLTR